MSQVEPCKVRQQNELEVLKSIFGDELRDLRKNRNKKRWQSLDIVITLTPQKGMSGPAEVYAQTDLHIVCCDKYPDNAPTIQLQDSRGLSHQQVAVLSSELENLAQEKIGEVMILDFCEHVRMYLHKHNKPGYSSFYEEMVSRNQEKIQCEMQEKQMKEDKERQVLQDAIQKRQAALKAEMRNRKETVRLAMDSDAVSRSIPSSPHERGTSRFRRRCASTSESSEGSLCEHRGIKSIDFDSNKGERQVHRGKCLGHSAKGSVVYAGVDTITGELLAITEWTLKYAMANGGCSAYESVDVHHTVKQIASLEQELNHLYKLYHPNLVHYLNMKYTRNSDSVVIYVLQEFVVGTTCSFFLMENIPVDVDMLRHLATGVLEALRYLHENNVVHKDLRDTSIYIDHAGVVKLSDYSLDKRLTDMYRSNSLAKAEHDFPTVQGRGGKKADIYRFGILLLSLLKGTIISGEEIDLVTIPQLHLRDFISKCLIDDERMRWSAEQLQQHGFIKIPLERGVLPSKPNHDEKEKNLEPEEPDIDIQLHLLALGRQSRIQNEFEVLKWLGKGAFGDVLKVRNKLDGGIYAIKRIELNPKKKQLNKKITREVKLLSRMNHENVVRYYNSWIESATLDDSVSHSRFTPITTSSDRATTQDKAEIQAESDEIEKFAPPLRDVEWNISYESRANAAHSDDENSDASTDSEEHCAFLSIRTLLRIESSDSIEFERDGVSQKSAATLDVSNNDAKNTETFSEDVTVKEIQFMYIQMEFCEKSTLRTAIDNGLYEDEERYWRLFREIVEGLAHIHQQGMIHRDLKPVNIFLDSNDHVKIGDFGLATTNILSSFVPTIDTDKESQFEKGGSFDVEELGSLTGQVGTALYVAPELSAKTAKAIYNQKVDIYSLGIIFFEMTYKPLTTGMERVKILLNLRSKEIVFPPDILEADMSQVHIIRWLLNYDPSQRPTAQELLSSVYLPPPLEETELQEVMRHTLSNSQSKAYRYLVASCFTQDVTPAEDITYDMNLPTRGTPSVLSSTKECLRESVKQKIVEIFQKHGGIYLATPLLMPKSIQHSNFTESSVKLMTRTGSIVSIPHDLRTPFARYVVWNNISHIRRYATERVFRDKKARGFHPRELYECAFDIIGHVDNNLMTETELIFIIWEIFNELPQIREHNFTVRLNHTSLLQAVLMYCGVEKDKYQDIYSILQDARDGKLTRFQVQTHLISLCLTDQAMETLFNLLETESSVAKIASVLKTITKRKGDAAGLAKEGLKDIETVISNVEGLGVKWPITVVPLLTYNVQQYSGVIYQITCELKHRRRRGGQDVIAAGGRYDKMLVSFRKVLERTGMASKETKQYGAGISISLDKLVSAVAEACESGESKCGIDVAVCCEGGPGSEGRKENNMINVLREIWSLGLKVTILDLGTMEEILEYCQENSISHIVLLRNGTLRVQTWERDRFHEKKWNTTQDIVEYLQRQSEAALPILNRSESKLSANNDIPVASSNPVNININFVLSERDKVSGSGRRSYKNTILAQTSSYLQRISHKVPVEIFAVFLEMSVIRTIISFLEIDEEEQTFQKSIQIVINKHPRHKKYIKQICEEMRELRNEKSKPVEILYSLTDSKHMTLI
ncbi:PREDICTED: eukaryotic translation initiation factor 2-alpha kinase 4 [Vollenhovia emeryi]|uniref:eukaryotic translation initiation factor 2-alpha kinase 4 n=1 Tax=Vollenhovia emeryi TaxID=411798 RepID=UPI0005F58C51|nr:PREDICTED: eukaryotic translation initiation factor 2-alpha kinase 4 [Vollenhovia emeryi]